MLLESTSINELIDIAKDYKEYNTIIYDSAYYGYNYGKTVYFMEIHEKKKLAHQGFLLRYADLTRD